eukprot:Hpha_TRINITY_DN18689_c0_g1::TRINITY_DN18689_c0_g1_i2::g.115781::m.115781
MVAECPPELQVPADHWAHVLEFLWSYTRSSRGPAPCTVRLDHTSVQACYEGPSRGALLLPVSDLPDLDRPPPDGLSLRLSTRWSRQLDKVDWGRLVEAELGRRRDAAAAEELLAEKASQVAAVAPVRVRAELVEGGDTSNACGVDHFAAVLRELSSQAIALRDACSAEAADSPVEVVLRPDLASVKTQPVAAGQGWRGTHRGEIVVAISGVEPKDARRRIVSAIRQGSGICRAAAAVWESVRKEAAALGAAQRVVVVPEERWAAADVLFLPRYAAAVTMLRSAAPRLAALGLYGLRVEVSDDFGVLPNRGVMSIPHDA